MCEAGAIAAEGMKNAFIVVKRNHYQNTTIEFK